MKPALNPNAGEGSDPKDVYAPWSGFLEITVRNVSRGMAHLVEIAWDEEYTVDIRDSSSKAVPLTERGRAKSDLAAHPDPNRPYIGAVSVFDLAPYEEMKAMLDLADLYEVRPNQAYRIRIRRTKGLPTVDENGKPLKQVEVSCSVEVPDHGILRQR